MITGLSSDFPKRKCELSLKQVNPHRINLCLKTTDSYEDWSLKEMGFSLQYAYRQNLRGTPLYETNHYELPQMLVSRLYKEYEESSDGKRMQGLATQVREWAEKEYPQWVAVSRDLLHTVKCIKQGDALVTNAIIRDWGMEPTDLVLKEWQLQALALYITLGYVNNWGQMRTGKTPPTIIWTYGEYLKRLETQTCASLRSKSKDGTGIDLTLIVCPNGIKHLWRQEIGKFTNEVVMSLSDVIQGTKKRKEALWYKPSIFKIVNYESLRSDIETVHEALDGKDYALVLDESHYIKNPSKQTAAVKSLFDSDNPPAYFAALSGTPVANKPQDVVRVVQITAPAMLGKSFDDFCDRFTYRDNYSNVSGFRKGALEEVHSQMARLSIRALRSEVNMDLGKVIQPRRVVMTGVQAETHRDLLTILRTELLSWDGSATAVQISTFLTQVMKLQQVTAGFLYDQWKTVHWIDDQKNPKMYWLDNFIKEYLDDIGKLVISCKFIPIIKKLALRYAHLGATYVCGEVPTEERVRRMNRFVADPTWRIFILNASTAEGMDLNPCQFMVQYTKDFQPKTNWQCEDRITGFNQTGEATIMPLLCQDSIDIKLEEILEKKQVWFDAVMGDEGKTTPDVVEGGLSMTKDDLFSLVG